MEIIITTIINNNSNNWVEKMNSSSCESKDTRMPGLCVVYITSEAFWGRVRSQIKGCNAWETPAVQCQV